MNVSNSLRQEALRTGAKTYFTGMSCKNGHVSNRRSANSSCMECNRGHQNNYRSLDAGDKDRESSRKWYAENRDKALAYQRNWIADNQEQYQVRRRKWRSNPVSRAREMVASARWSAKIKGMPFDLTREWLQPIIEAGVCQLTGLPFRLESLDGGLQNPYTASIDRIIPNLGYVKSNVRVILWALNAAFNSYGEFVFAEIAKVYLEQNMDRIKRSALT